MGKDNQSSQLRLLLLGSPRFELANVPLEISRRKAIALLVYLAVTGEVHRRETLATLFWPDYDESKAHAYLRRTLWSLKQALGDEYLVAEREQIGLVRNETVWLDVARFRQLLSETQKHGHRADEVCADCLALLTEAANLYRGDFLAGFTLPDAPDFDEWQFFQAESLRQELASALEHLVQGHTAQGDFETAIPHTRRWLSLDPLHEPAHQQLMQLYAWSGQQAAALRQYQECVRIFDEEFGASPSEETTALYEAIKAKGLSSPSGVKQPVDEVEFEVTAAKSTIVNRKSEIENRHNLPPQPTPFIGRGAELVALDDLIANPEVRLMTIVGPGGMGKTRLSIQAAKESLNNFPDGVYFVPLAPISSAEFLVSAITDALNISIYGATDPKSQLLTYLREKATLLVLDNFEHLLAPLTNGDVGVNLLSEIVLAAPRVQLLVSSRERLNVQEEWVFELQGMKFPAATDSPPLREGLGEGGPKQDSTLSLKGRGSEYSALQLFEQRARQVQADFDLSAEYPGVVRICQLVSGIPLGLELAVTWLKLMSCREVAHEIEQNLDFLATSMRNVPERHRSLRAVFEHSWQLLSDEERDVFKKLSVFRGGFLREAAEQVTRASLPLLSALVDKSLLRRTKTGRYEIHELLRQYAEEQLETISEESEAVQAGHARYYSNFLHLRETDLRGARQKEALEEIAAELDNVRVSWNWAVEQAKIDLIGKSLQSLYYFSEMRGRARDGEALLQRAMVRLTELGIGQSETTVDEHKIILGSLMGRQGHLSERIGVYQQGMALEEQGISMLRQVEHGAEVHLAVALNKFSLTVYFITGDLDKAKQFVQEALTLAKAIDHKVEIAYAYNVMGHLAEFQGEYAEAGPLFEESIRHYQEIGEKRGCAYSQNNWGRAAYAMGQYDQAEELIQAALAVRREVGDLIGLSYSLLDLGKLAKMRGQYAEAKNYIKEALSIVEEIGVQDTIARCYLGLGMVAEGERDFEQAEALHQKSLTIYHEIGVKRALPLTLNHLSRAAYERGEYQLAQQRLQDCLAACDELGNRGERASALRHLGHVAVAMGNYLEAKHYFQQALEILVETGAMPVALDILVGWTTMLTKHDPTDTDQMLAIELLTLVQYHPASEYETKEKAKCLLAEWVDHLPAEMMSVAETQGKARDLTATIHQLSQAHSK